MESLDRKMLNTEIVCMRHDVQRAKVMALRKMVRRTVKLRAKKGTEQAKAKNERKAERLIEEIQDMKKSRPDEVTKYALVNSEASCLKTISNAESPAISKALARIACEKIVISKLKALQEKYYNWNDAPTFLQPAPKKAKKPKSEDMSGNSVSGLEPENSIISEEDESDLEGEENGSSIDSEEGSDVESGNEDVDDEEHSDSCSSSPESGVSSPVPLISIPSSKEKKKVDIKEKPPKQKEVGKNFIKLKTTKESLLAIKPMLQNKSKTSTSVAVVRKITNLEDLEQLESVTSRVGAAVNETRKDSFFLSADGEEVESEVEEEAEGSGSEEESGEELERGPNRVYHSRGKPETQERKRTFGLLNSKQEWHGSHDRRAPRDAPQLKRFETSQGNRKQPPAKLSKGAPLVKSEEKLHPSWEAKRKLKEAIQIGKGTQNKKIKFDD